MMDNCDQNTFTGVDWIDRNPLFVAVGSSLQKPEQQGVDLIENELFDEVDTELMKRGTLNHSSIRWDWVCEQCAKLLSQESKDFRLLLYILQSLPNVKNYGAPLTLGTVLTSRFVGIWGDVAYPVKNKRLPILRKIVDAIETLIEHSKKFNLEQENIELSARSLRQCVDFFKKFDQNFEQQLFSMANRIEAAAIPDENDGSQSLEKIIKEPFVPKPILEIKENEGSSQQTLELHPENLVLNEKSERALKQSLTIVADFILHMDIENPLSYRLRRFATWYGISNAPEQRRKDDLKTVILPVSANALDEYRTAAERGQTDFDIAFKLEKSCHNQPFWLEGQYLAYKLAVICNRQLAAEAIYETTYSFVSKTDWIKRLQFADGSPFMPEAVKTWMETYGKASTTGTSLLRVENEMIGGEMQAIALKAREKANHGNTDEAIRILEAAKPTQDTPRSKTLWEMLMLECISDWGMKNLVSTQAKRLKKDIESMMVKDYEPDIIDRISRLEITTK